MSLAQELKETADRWHSEKVEIPKELLMELKKAAENGAYTLYCYDYIISNKLRKALEAEEIKESYKSTRYVSYCELSWR